MALVQGPIVGKDCKAYLNTGTYATPTWTEMSNAVNVSINLPKGEAATSARSSSWATVRGALKAPEVSMTYRHIQGSDTIFDSLLDSYLNGTHLEVAFMDADISESGAQGLRMFAEVMQLNQSQELEGTVEYDMTLKPVYHEESGSQVDPQWYEVP